MKMIPGSGIISNYGSYISNCQRRQMPYRIPVNTLQDVQLYIAIGATKPDAVQYQLIHTCQPNSGVIETLATPSYIVGQDTNGNWFGVFKNFADSPNITTCFVIAITLTFGDTDTIYFSEEYCIEPTCNPLTLLKGCYGNLDNLLSYDCEGIYFSSHVGPEIAMGDTTIRYKHELLLRGVEVSLSAIKNSFKQGRTRNFRTEKEKIYQFYGELIPEWYLPELDAIFYRGEVYVGNTRYLVNETQFEKIEDCYRQWKPSATFKDSCYQSFSCETDPCNVPACCDPVIISASRNCCSPTIISADSTYPPVCRNYTITNNSFGSNDVYYLNCAGEEIYNPASLPNGAHIDVCAIEGTVISSGSDVTPGSSCTE